MNKISIDVSASQARNRMVQELLFSLDWKWKESGKVYKAYSSKFINLDNPSNRTFTQSASLSNHPIVSSEDFINDPFKYIPGVISNQ